MGITINIYYTSRFKIFNWKDPLKVGSMFLNFYFRKIILFVESAKLRALRALIPHMPRALRALVPRVHRALGVLLPHVPRALRAIVP